MVCLTHKISDRLGFTATQNLFTNLNIARLDTPKLLASFGTKLDYITVTPTLVRGIYAIQNHNNGQPVLFTNQAGTLLGGSDRVYVVPTTGEPIRPITSAEKDELRAEVMRNIDFDKLIKVTFGNGGGRHLLMLSAIDCPACKAYEIALLKGEVSLEKQGKSLNTTFYVIPGSLRPLEPNGWDSWKIVSSLWCSGDQGRAWQTYWALGQIPRVDIAHCTFPPREAESARNAMLMVLNGVGASSGASVPQLIQENGTIFDRTRVKDTEYGAAGLPLVAETVPKWLVGAEDEAQFSSKPIGKPSTARSMGQVKTINLGNVLNGLFKNSTQP